MKRVYGLIFCLMALAASSTARAETYDVVIRHGRVVDGSGNPGFFADLAVRDGRIVEIGKVSGDAKMACEIERALPVPSVEVVAVVVKQGISPKDCSPGSRLANFLLGHAEYWETQNCR